MKKAGLFSLYREEGEFRLLIRRILAMPLLPRDLYTIFWEQLIRPALEQLNDARIAAFIDYFQGQWMSLDPRLWNFHRLVDRTINAGEAYHSFLKR